MAWSGRTQFGDMAELEALPDDSPLLPMVTSTVDNCLGTDCPFYSECFVVQARQRAQAADLVVVNHHLLLADLALKQEGFGEILPGAQAFVIDEAHQLPELAANFFGESFGVRGVLDPQGKLLKRYDKTPAPAQEGDSVAANLISIGLQQVVSGGTARQLLGDGLGRLSSAGKTGTSNDGRDSWYAGYTGDHLAVIWMGNDQNAETGLYGATGAMRVWSSIFARLPSAPLKVSGKGLDWQWVDASGTGVTDPGCPGARQFPFVVGFTPAYAPCAGNAPSIEAAPGEAAAPAEQSSGGGWRRFFGLEKKPEDPAAAPAAAPPTR